MITILYLFCKLIHTGKSTGIITGVFGKNSTVPILTFSLHDNSEGADHKLLVIFRPEVSIGHRHYELAETDFYNLKCISVRNILPYKSIMFSQFH